MAVRRTFRLLIELPRRFLLQIIEEGADQRRIQVREVQARGRLAAPLLDKVQKQPERVPVGGDGVWAGLPLGHQSLREVALQQGW